LTGIIGSRMALCQTKKRSKCPKDKDFWGTLGQ
jgi:hypothetical protein